MPAPRVAAIDSEPALDSLDPASGECAIEVRFAEGGASTFLVATFDRPAARLRAPKADAWWSTPVLFVSRLDRPTIEAAVAAMAADMGGYWLRYYNSLGALGRRRA